ncbi:calpain small subunit 1-like [Pholidichthys leucotaenia]
MFRRIFGGIMEVVSQIDIKDFFPSDPPAPCPFFARTDENETEEEKQFRQIFHQLAGDDMEVCPEELMNTLNNVVCKCSDLKTDGFSIETCKAMVAVLDRDCTGKLGFHEFKALWNNIKRWKGCYVNHDADCSGVVCCKELPGTFKEAGFPLNDDLVKLLKRRYGDEHGDMDFDNFIGCIVRLDSMCRAFKTLDQDDSGSIDLDITEWLEITMYS